MGAGAWGPGKITNHYSLFVMKDIDILESQFDEEQPAMVSSELRAGFPSPAADYSQDSLDFNRDLIQHPESTFYGRVRGDSMSDAGINDGDIAVIDKSMEPHNGSVIVAYINNEFTIKFLDTTHCADGYIELRPANAKYPLIRIDENDDFEVWGVVVYTIKSWLR